MKAARYMATKPCKNGNIAWHTTSSRGCLCRPCKTAKNKRESNRRKKRRANPIFGDKMRAKWSAKNAADPRTMMVSQAAFRSKRDGLPFNLKRADITLNEFCPALGARLEVKRGRGPQDNSPTLDRIIPHLGYVRGNVVVISHLANRIKSNATAEQLRKVAAWLDVITTGDNTQ